MLLRKNANIIMDKIYEKAMIKFFKAWIKKYCNIDCFAVLVILPDNDMLHLSTNPALTQVYSENNYGLIDQPTNRRIYEKHVFYPWRLPNATNKQQEVHSVREKIFNLNSGTNFVRKITTDQGLFHVIYCCSSFEKDHLNYFKFTANVNAIMEAGDFAYNSLLPIFQENCEKYNLPKIDKSSMIVYENVHDLIKNYTVIGELYKEVMDFLKKSPIIDESDYTFKQGMKLVIENKDFVKKQSNKSSQPILYLVK
ncbi:MAG: hypothetical protein KIT27_08330 [Legionellales bacterium]|nr:hypothetical protein [Legionellales bacterium]